MDTLSDKEFLHCEEVILLLISEDQEPWALLQEGEFIGMNETESLVFLKELMGNGYLDGQDISHSDFLFTLHEETNVHIDNRETS